MPKAEATTAWRTTGRWCTVSWKPSGKPTISTELPTSTAASSRGRCSGVKARSTAASGSAARSISIIATSISPPESVPWRHWLRPSRNSSSEKPVERVRSVASVCSSISMRFGWWRDGVSTSTWRLVTRNRRSSRTKKKPAGAGEPALVLEGGDAGGGEQQGIDHGARVLRSGALAAAAR